jgi:hypothetical protein
VSDSIQKTTRELRRRGFIVVLTRGRHLKIRQDGMSPFVIAPSTAGSRFQVKQTKAALSRAKRREALR